MDYRARGSLVCHRKERKMVQFENRTAWMHKIVITSLVLVGLMTLGSAPVFSDKPETIEASAMGTGTQMGQVYEFRLIINEYSTMEDRQVLVQAFEKGQNQGLVNALSRMRAVGHVSLTGTLGYDCSFIRLIQTPTGRKIRFVTTQQLLLREVGHDVQAQWF